MDTSDASSSGTVASDPTATAQSVQQQEAAAAAGAAGTAAPASVSTAGAADSSFPTFNSAILDPGYSFGMASAGWWQALQHFLDVVQKAYADAGKAQQSVVRGQPATPATSRTERITVPEFGPGGVQGKRFGKFQRKGTIRTPAEQGQAGITRGQVDMEEVRQAARAVGITIPQNITQLDQLGQLKVPPAVRTELTQAGMNPMAMATIGSLSQQAVPVNQVEQPVTSQDLYNQFVKDWGNGTGDFAKLWTQDLVNTGLLDAQHVQGGVGAALEVGTAYQTLLAAAKKDNKTPAQEVGYLASLPANQGHIESSGLAIDATEAAQSAFYQYGVNPSTGTVQKIVDQVMSMGLGSPYEISRQATAVASQQALQWAKTMFPSVAGQLNYNPEGQSNDVRTLLGPYINSAAQMLGVNPDTVDMTDPKWQKGLTGGANGGQMSMDEWNKTIASDPQYGYQYSQTGLDRAASVAMSVRNMFGLEGPSAASDWNYSG